MINRNNYLSRTLTEKKEKYLLYLYVVTGGVENVLPELPNIDNYDVTCFLKAADRTSDVSEPGCSWVTHPVTSMYSLFI